MFGRIGVFTLVFIIASPVFAQGGPPSPEVMVQRMDADGDGKISREEFRGPPPRFDMIDANKDGFLTKEEIVAFRAARGGGAGAGPGPGTGLGAGGGVQAFWLKGEQVKQLITGSEITHTSPRSGSAVQLVFKGDGSLGGTAGKAEITGTWNVRPDGLLCFEASALGDKICFYLIRKGNEIQRLTRQKAPAKGINWKIVKAGPGTGTVADGVFR
jgi:hypothetical protein